MQLMSSRLSRGTKEQVSPVARPLGIVLTFLALGLGLLAATGPYKTASANSIFSDYKPAGPAQPAACVDQGTQNPVDANGGAVTVNMLEGNTSVSERTPIHQVTLTAGGAQVNNFCLDLTKQILAESYCQQGSATSPELMYLLTNYPPTVANRTAQAARQAAVWHFTNGVTLQDPDATDEGTAVDKEVLDAYNAILTDIAAHINPADPPAQYLAGPPQLTVTPASASVSLDVSTVHTVTVSLTNSGKPLVGFTVNVTSSLGTVNKASAVTNAQGQADFVVTNAISGTSAIVASAQVILPLIRVFQSEAAPEGNQPIGGPSQSIYDPSFQAAATWVSPSSLEEVDEPNTAWLLFLPALDD
jgi:TQXA domain-containing protein